MLFKAKADLLEILGDSEELAMSDETFEVYEDDQEHSKWKFSPN